VFGGAGKKHIGRNGANFGGTVPGICHRDLTAMTFVRHGFMPVFSAQPRNGGGLG
jgi:hypothetical protein